MKKLRNWFIGDYLAKTNNAFEGNMRDGMDIAICVLDKKTNTLEYAGAGNPLYHISDKVLKEINNR